MQKPRTEDGRERLHVRIAHSGMCSRRAAEKLIQEGRVEVNGNIVTEMGILVGAEDEVRVDGAKVGGAERHITLLLNKPKGYVTTLSDPQRRPTISSLLPDLGVTLKPVGRLDMDTEGLLLCTNEGELAHRLTHPSFGVEKEYHATVEGVPDEKTLEKLRKGVYIDGGKTAPAQVEIMFGERNGSSAKLKLVIHEGRNRQIRLMCEAVGHRVTQLKRVRIAMLTTKAMRSGEARVLLEKEVNALKRLVQLAAD